VFLGKRGGESPFGHAFGGSADYAGLAIPDGQPPAHQLLRLNTADPAVGVSLPGAEWLPFLCAIRYGACDQGYQVVSDAEAFALGMMLSNRPAMVSAQPAGGHGKCVGVATRDNVVYRAFENGTVETFNVGAPNDKWTQVGK
jgi:hypothetical protein